MRTTLDIPDDANYLAKATAQDQQLSFGRVVGGMILKRVPGAKGSPLRMSDWPDDASYLDLPTRGINGHRQVTDAYLALLAAKHGGVLATMDRALAATQQGVLLLDEAS